MALDVHTHAMFRASERLGITDPEQLEALWKLGSCRASSADLKAFGTRRYPYYLYKVCEVGNKRALLIRSIEGYWVTVRAL